MFNEQYYVPKLKEIAQKELLTMRDMASEMGVSYTTMRAVIMRDKPVKMKTKKKIREFIDKHEEKNGR